MSTDMDLIVSVQRTQFLALREMQQRREVVTEFLAAFQESVDGLPTAIHFDRTGPLSVIKSRDELANLIYQRTSS